MTLTLLAATPVARADTEPDLPKPSITGPGFFADHAVFPSDRGGALLLVYFQVAYTELRFQKTAAGYRLTFDVSVILYGGKDRQVAGDLWTYTIAESAYAATVARENFFRRKIELPVPAGTYRCVVRMRGIDTGTEGQVEFPVRVPDFNGNPLSLSDITFGLTQSEVTFWDAPFSVGGILPYPPRRYGTTLPEIAAYAEVRDTLPADTSSHYEVRFRVTSEADVALSADTLQVPRKGGRGSFLLKPHSTELPLGIYLLHVEARLGKSRSVRERWFEINEGRVSFINDLYVVRNVLAYIATGVELTELDTLRVESLPSYWETFWGRRNTDGPGARNRALSEFLRRYEYANQRFSVLGPGWASDMGKIYIKYGEPDEIERQIIPPLERWFYLARDAIFVFSDPDGFGRFRLIGPRRD